MEIAVGLIQGAGPFFTSNRPWPMVKLGIESDHLDFTCGFKTQRLRKKQILRLSRHPGFCWFFAQSIRIEHDSEDLPSFLVAWVFDLGSLQTALVAKGYEIEAARG